MIRGEHCKHLLPDYTRLEDAFYIRRDPDTYEISWPPTRMMDQLRKLGLVSESDHIANGAEAAPEPR